MVWLRRVWRVVVLVLAMTATAAIAQEQQFKPKKPLPPKTTTAAPPTTATTTTTVTTETEPETDTTTTLTESNVNLVPEETNEQIFMINNDNNMDGLPVCDLHCRNGGICNYVTREVEQLTSMVQSGRMIQQCSCPDSFTGMACEFSLQQQQHHQSECHSNNNSTNKLLCHNNDDDDDHCADATKISKFAGMMCRKPYTEYCSDQFEPSESQVSYCTNGGKCKSSLVSAQVSPGNVTANNSYKHLGCVCPREFYGPHCELLQYSSMQESGAAGKNNETEKELPDDSFEFDEGFWERDNGSTSASSGTNVSGDDSGDKHFLSILFIVLAALFASAVLCAMYYNCYFLSRRHRLRRKSDHVIGKTDESQSPDPPSVSSNYDDDYLPIRRRHSPTTGNNCSNHSMVYDNDIEENEPLDSAPPPSVSSFYQDNPHGSNQMMSTSSYHSSIHSSSQTGRDHYIMPGAGNTDSKATDVDEDDDPSIIILHNNEKNHLDIEGSSHAPILVNPSMLDDETNDNDSMMARNNRNSNGRQRNAESLFPLTFLGGGGGGEQQRRTQQTKASGTGPFYFF